MQFDAIVVGGSFAGLSAAMQLARARRSVCVIDAGQPRNRFADAAHGFFGQDGTPPLDMIAQARARLLAYPAVTFIEAEAETARAGEGGFAVGFSNGGEATAAGLVLAFGVTDELPDLPGLAERWGRSVLHCPYCHGYEFEGAPLGVLSVGPMSHHQASLIPEWGPTTFFLNGTECEPEIATALTARGVALERRPVLGLTGDAPGLDGVRLADGRVVPVKGLYLGTRTHLASPLAEQLGCAIDQGVFGPVIRTDAGQATSVPGVYAAGDAAREPHNATWASADGVTAGVSLHRQLVFGLPAAA